MAAASSSSSSSATIGGFTYDVFLSFRGEDTRYEFTGSLWKALVDKGIRAFFDEEDIPKGDEITPSLLQSIEQSRMALVVLSPNYASSSFCLDELFHILDSIRGNGRFVWPIFYEVDPSDVRKIKGTYGEAMDKHEANSRYNTERLEKWKTALQQVANLSGTHFKKGEKYLYKFIEEIVEEVSTKIKHLTLHISDNQVGLGDRIKDVISLLNLGSDDEIRMVGIHGIGGIGKTTLAVAVFNSIASQFHGSCYLENVREKSEKHELTYLQEIVLSKIVGEKKIELTSFREGIETIKQRLGQKKVLLLLDDVDKEEQLQAIVGRPDWFGRGSRVIITTRDTRLLTCHEVESKYEVKLLNKEDAFELLRQKAIRTNKVTPSYIDVLNRVLTYASGLPLALEVIGSHLFKKTVEECKYVLDRYERIPDPKIQTILKVSFDALDEEEKCIFLDIACIFKGLMLNDVEKNLHAHYGESKKHHINVLVEKSLIKINGYGAEITLHDLIIDMGEEIVRQESPYDPGRRSRLWDPKDIVQVLEENRGTSKIEMIYFDSSIEVKWNGEAFKKMENLKTLVITKLTFLESPKHLPNSLRVLEWWNYSGDVPSDFYPKRLVIYRTSFMSEDFFRKKFENMRILNIQYCDSLTQIPDISCLLNLEEFSLNKCDNLIRTDGSVGLLDKLKFLELWICKKLKSIAPLKLPSLEYLNLGYCDSLESFPLVLDGSLDKLKSLTVENCGNLKSFPQLKLASLEELHLEGCESLESFPLVLDGSLDKLKSLRVEYCGNLKSFPQLKLASLEELHLKGCGSLESFPLVLDGSLGKLKSLRVESCRNLKSFPQLKLASLEELHLKGCGSLESFPLVLDGSLGKLKSLRVEYCGNLKSFPQLKLASLEELHLAYCHSLESFPLVLDGSLGKLKSLRVEYCGNLKSFPQLKLASLEELHLAYCHSLESFPLVLGKLKSLRVESCRNLKSFLQLKLASLEELHLADCGLKSFLHLVDGWMGKLKILRVICCRNHRSIPPIKFASLENLRLSCHCCEYDREELHWNDTPLKELPFSFQDLTCLQTLYLKNCGIVQFPTSSIVVMSNLVELTIEYGGWIFPNQNKGEEKVIPIQSSRVEILSLINCKLSDESLAIGLKWFANVKELDLSWSEFTTLPECIKNCHFLWKLVMDNCKKLQEIKGIPPNVNTISAFNCSSLTSSCTTKLLNQELHKFGNTNFILPGVEIPNWFYTQDMQESSISFWFRIKFPAIALCAVSLMTCDYEDEYVDEDDEVCLKVTINGMEYFYKDDIHNFHYRSNMYHLWLFHMQNQKLHADLDTELFENKWNHAVVDFELGVFNSGIHVLKEISSMEDIRFDNPENDVSMRGYSLKFN